MRKAKKIIKYFNANNCTVKFEDGTIVEKVSYGRVSRGQVKNPNSVTTCGVGYMGRGKYNAKDNFNIYQKWLNMLQRCYSEKCENQYPTYKNVTVCKEWHNFQNFAKWFEENHTEDWDLDKDLLSKEDKQYSPDTCCFIPTEINASIITLNRQGGKYPLGVYKRANKYWTKVCMGGEIFHYGSYDTPEDAFEKYKSEKISYIKSLAEKWKESLPKKVYYALLEYDFTIREYTDNHLPCPL